jgi:hypothetical protein
MGTARLLQRPLNVRNGAVMSQSDSLRSASHANASKKDSSEELTDERDDEDEELEEGEGTKNAPPKLLLTKLALKSPLLGLMLRPLPEDAGALVLLPKLLLKIPRLKKLLKKLLKAFGLSEKSICLFFLLCLGSRPLPSFLLSSIVANSSSMECDAMASACN